MRNRNGRLHYSFRIYALYDGKSVLGKGGAQILNAVDRLGSLSAAAKELNRSYRFVWNYVRRMEDRLGKPVIVTRRGGVRHVRRKGGGMTKLTPVARTLLEDCSATKERLREQLLSRKRKSLWHTVRVQNSLSASTNALSISGIEWRS
jgi:molybdate transport system regulatory protein